MEIPPQQPAEFLEELEEWEAALYMLVDPDLSSSIPENNSNQKIDQYIVPSEETKCLNTKCRKTPAEGSFPPSLITIFPDSEPTDNSGKSLDDWNDTREMASDGEGAMKAVCETEEIPASMESWAYLMSPSSSSESELEYDFHPGVLGTMTCGMVSEATVHKTWIDSFPPLLLAAYRRGTSEAALATRNLVDLGQGIQDIGDVVDKGIFSRGEKVGIDESTGYSATVADGPGVSYLDQDTGGVHPAVDENLLTGQGYLNLEFIIGAEMDFGLTAFYKDLNDLVDLDAYVACPTPMRSWTGQEIEGAYIAARDNDNKNENPSLDFMIGAEMDSDFSGGRGAFLNSSPQPAIQHFASRIELPGIYPSKRQKLMFVPQHPDLQNFTPGKKQWNISDSKAHNGPFPLERRGGRPVPPSSADPRWNIWTIGNLDIRCTASGVGVKHLKEVLYRDSGCTGSRRSKWNHTKLRAEVMSRRAKQEANSKVVGRPKHYLADHGWWCYIESLILY